MGLSSVRIKKRSTDISSTTTTTESSALQQHAGLRIVILQISEFDEYYSNTIVVKSGLKSLTATSSIIFSPPSSSSSSSSVISSDNNGGEFTCFLTSCHLCKRPLSPDKDVYMYRGDQGFCSEECRSRQIMVDEMKEMDEKTKRRLKNGGATASPMNNCAGCETCRLLEDLRRHRRRRNTNKFKPTPALISPAKHQPLVSFS